MTLLFRPEYVLDIKAERKKQTRRLWRIGYAVRMMKSMENKTVHKLKIHRYKKPYFALAILTMVIKEPLCMMKQKDVVEEGFPDLTVLGFANLIYKINGILNSDEQNSLWTKGELIDGTRSLYRVEWKLVEG